MDQTSETGKLRPVRGGVAEYSLVAEGLVQAGLQPGLLAADVWLVPAYASWLDIYSGTNQILFGHVGSDLTTGVVHYVVPNNLI